jgi:hypothetical protein
MSHDYIDALTRQSKTVNFSDTVDMKVFNPQDAITFSTPEIEEPEVDESEVELEESDTNNADDMKQNVEGFDYQERKLIELASKLNDLSKVQYQRKFRAWCVKYNMHLRYLHSLTLSRIPCTLSYPQFCWWVYMQTTTVPTSRYGWIRP